MERRGIKGEKKRREREVCRELREKEERKERGRREKEERILCECKSFITTREISDFGIWKQARRLILVSFPNFVEKFVVPHLGFDNSKFGKTGETSQSN